MNTSIKMPPATRWLIFDEEWCTIVDPMFEKMRYDFCINASL